MDFNEKDKQIRKYHCIAYGIYGSLGICEGCAINCHINHSIKFVGIEEFVCTCQSTENCIMMMAPLLHNDRKICDRKVLNSDNVSSCYTCYTYDESGKLMLCETCALKNHLDHEVHFVGYMKFEYFHIHYFVYLII